MPAKRKSGSGRRTKSSPRRSKRGSSPARSPRRSSSRASTRSGGSRRRVPSTRAGDLDLGDQRRGGDGRMYEVCSAKDGRSIWRHVAAVRGSKSGSKGRGGCAKRRCRDPCDNENVRPKCGPAHTRIVVQKDKAMYDKDGNKKDDVASYEMVYASKRDQDCLRREDCERSRRRPMCVDQRALLALKKAYEKKFECAVAELCERDSCLEQEIKRLEKRGNTDCKDLKQRERHIVLKTLKEMRSSMERYGVFQAYQVYLSGSLCDDDAALECLYRDYFKAWRLDVVHLLDSARCDKQLAYLVRRMILDVDTMQRSCGYKAAMRYLCSWDDRSFENMDVLKTNIRKMIKDAGDAMALGHGTNVFCHNTKPCATDLARSPYRTMSPMPKDEKVIRPSDMKRVAKNDPRDDCGDFERRFGYKKGTMEPFHYGDKKAARDAYIKAGLDSHKFKDSSKVHLKLVGRKRKSVGEKRKAPLRAEEGEYDEDEDEGGDK